MQRLYDSLDYHLRYRLCTARLYLGDFSNWTGWAYRCEWAAQRLFLEQRIARWDGRWVGRLWVVGEQGLGDEILWASVIPEAMLRAAQVTYSCDARLVSLLERSLPGLRCIPRDDEDDPNDEFDAFIPAGDLLPMFRRRRQDFPAKTFLRPDPQRVAQFERYRGRTGVSWLGRQGSIDPARFEVADPLTLQHSVGGPPEMPEGLDLKDDIEGVVALCSLLERVVCVPSTIHHLAGAVGCAVDVIWPEVPGEVLNQVPWSHPPGKLAWYPNVTVWSTLREWKASHAPRPQL
jgi:hypothetical protein